MRFVLKHVQIQMTQQTIVTIFKDPSTPESIPERTESQDRILQPDRTVGSETEQSAYPGNSGGDSTGTTSNQLDPAPRGKDTKNQNGKVHFWLTISEGSDGQLFTECQAEDTNIQAGNDHPRIIKSSEIRANPKGTES